MNSLNCPHTVFFIRHGQTNWNAVGRIQGQFDTTLSTLGRTQAARNGLALSDAIENLNLTPENFAWVCSPLSRCRHTMAIARDQFHQPLPHPTYDDQIKEISFGDWEGYKRAQIKALHPKAFRTRQELRWDFRPPNGESWSDLYHRVLEWVNNINRDSIIFSHGGVSRMMRGYLFDLPPEEIMTLEVPQDQIFVWQKHQGIWL